MRFPDWPRDHPVQPLLGDIACQESGPGSDDADTVGRCYLVVGVAETATGYRLHLERVAYGTLPASPRPDAFWTFHNRPRGG